MNRRMGMRMSGRMGMWSAGAAVAALALSGCGGGGGGNSRTTIHGDLRSGDQTLPSSFGVESGSYVDFYSCTARSDGSAQVDLKSSDFNSFLIVGTEDRAGVIHTITTNYDPNGRDAHAEFNVSQDVRYFVAATTTDGAGRTGSYELDFSDNLKDVTEETSINPSVRAAAARALQAYRAQKAPSGTPTAPAPIKP